MEELEFSLPSGRIAAVARGPADGRPVVCVHGLSANARAFDDIAGPLVQQGRRVVALDLRGRGRSEITPPGTYGLDAHAADVLAVADRLGADTFDVVGWSMGALIGIALAAPAGGRLERLVLIDHAGAMDDAAVDAVRAGLNRLEARVGRPEDYVAAVRAAAAITHWNATWEAFYRYELAQCADGQWAPSTDKAACTEDLDGALLVVEERWTGRWSALTMPTLLVRCSVPLNGGFVVPAATRDALAAAAPGLTVLEVEANHFDVMCDPATRSAIAQHLA